MTRPTQSGLPKLLDIPGQYSFNRRFFSSLSGLARLRAVMAIFCVAGTGTGITLFALYPTITWFIAVPIVGLVGLISASYFYLEISVGSLKTLAIVISAGAIVAFVMGVLDGIWGERWPWLHGFLPPQRPLAEDLLVLFPVTMVMYFFGHFLVWNLMRQEGGRAMRLQTEIGLAQQIHSTLVPPIEQTTDRLELYGRSDPCTEVGGDLIDVIEGDGKLGVWVADVSGHGVRAGVLMAMIKSAVRMKILSEHALGSLFDDLNRVVLQVKHMDMFATVSCIQFDGSNEVKYILAGHPPILHYRQRDNRIDELEAAFPPVGVLSTLKHEHKKAEMSQGDIFVLLTDGCTEVFDKDDEEFGIDRLKSILLSNVSRSLPEIYHAILSAVHDYGPQDDDQTLLLVRVR